MCTHPHVLELENMCTVQSTQNGDYVYWEDCVQYALQVPMVGMAQM